MQSIEEKLLQEEEMKCLPSLGWAFIGIAVLPHVLMLAGQEILGSIAACTCFPLTMGPLALVHSYLVVNRMGYISHIAWLSAVLFSITWFGFVCWSWRKSKKVTVAVCSVILIITAEWIWVGILP